MNISFLSSTSQDQSTQIKENLVKKIIYIPIGEIYAQVANSATSYYSVLVLPYRNLYFPLYGKAPPFWFFIYISRML